MLKTGLVLEGGGMRGIYTAGVLDVFLENGIAFDGVIGVSAGGIHGCSYLSGQKGRSIRYYEKYCKDPRFLSIWSLLLTGNMVGAKFCYHTIPEKLDPYDFEAFRQNGVPFYVGCTNVETGESEYLRVNDMKTDIDCLRASASLPYVSRIVRIGAKKYLDGGCTDSIPVDAFRKMGYERNVLILTRPADYVRPAENVKTAKRIYGRYPRFVEAFGKHHERYNQTLCDIKHMEADGSAFVIRPEAPLEIGRLEKDPQNIRRIYEIGYADGHKQLERLLLWMRAKDQNNSSEEENT